MGLLDGLLGGRLSNQPLVNAITAHFMQPTDDSLVNVWQSFLKTRVFVATTEDGARTFSRAKNPETAKIPWHSVKEKEHQGLLACFADNESFDAYAPEGWVKVAVSSDQALAFARNAKARGLLLNPGTEEAFPLKSWQHLVYIEKTDDARKLQDLSLVLRLAGHMEDSEGCLKAAIAISSKKPGPQHPQTAELSRELAYVFHLQGKDSESEWLYKRALSVYEACGTHAMEVAQTAEALADILKAQDKISQALPLYEKALNIFDSVPGAKISSHANIMLTLAEVQLAEGQNASAEALIKRAVCMLEERRHHDLPKMLNKLGEIYFKSNRHMDADASFKRSIQACEADSKSNPAFYAEASIGLGLLALEHKRFDEAEDTIEKALRIYRNIQDPIKIALAEAHLVQIKKRREAQAKTPEPSTTKQASELTPGQVAAAPKHYNPSRGTHGAAPRSTTGPKKTPPPSLAGFPIADGITLRDFRNFLDQFDKDQTAKGDISQISHPRILPPDAPADAPKEPAKESGKGGGSEQETTHDNLPPSALPPEAQAAQQAAIAAATAQTFDQDTTVTSKAQTEEHKNPALPGEPKTPAPSARADERAINRLECDTLPPFSLPSYNKVQIEELPADQGTQQAAMLADHSAAETADVSDLEFLLTARTPSTADAKDTATLDPLADLVNSLDNDTPAIKLPGDVSKYDTPISERKVDTSKYDTPISERRPEPAKADNSKYDQPITKTTSTSEILPDNHLANLISSLDSSIPAIKDPRKQDATDDAFDSGDAASAAQAQSDEGLDALADLMQPKSRGSGASMDSPIQALPTIPGLVPGAGGKVMPSYDISPSGNVDTSKAPPPRQSPPPAAAGAAEADSPAASVDIDGLSPEEALSKLEKACESNPKNHHAWYQKGNLLLKQERLDEAVKCFDKVTMLDAKNVDALYSKAVCLFKKQRFEDAVYCYNFVLQINPKHASCLADKADCLVKLGRAEQAISSYEKALNIDPLLAKAWVGKGKALQNSMRFAEAIEAYDAALELEPGNSDAERGKRLCTSKLNN